MSNKKKVLLYVLLSVLIAVQVVVVSINIKLWLKIVLVAMCYVGILVGIILHTKHMLKTLSQLEAKKAGEAKAIKPASATLLDIYAVLKIAPQYNPDGTLKDMYQLLGIEPQYDANGNRIETIYERLGINPMFNANGQEIPYVVRIKNRVNSIVTLKAAPLPLIYIPREEKAAGKQGLPVLPEPILTEQTEKAPSFKQLPVVKPVLKKAAAKPAKAPAVNYGKGGAKVSVSDNKISYHATVIASGAGGGVNLFAIAPRKSDKTENTKPETAPVVTPPHVEPPKVERIIVKIPAKKEEIPPKPSKDVRVEPSKPKKDGGYVEFSSVAIVSQDGIDNILENN